jgi:hypothetical protein
MVDEKTRYITEAAEHGRCLEIGDFRRGNAAIERMMSALAKLRARPDRGESILIELLNHPNGWVKLSAATDLLPLRPDLGSATLEGLALGPQGQLEFNAMMVLREWRAGRLNVP